MKCKCKCGCNQWAERDGMVKTNVGRFIDYSHAALFALEKSRKQAERNARKAEKTKLSQAMLDRKALKKRMIESRPRSWYLKEAQKWFNKFIRLRDADKPCISCGRHHAGQYHAGHYRTVGSSPELRFNELNCHKQCAPCNNHLSGNIVNYRIGLIAKIGIKLVESLEGYHEPEKHAIDDLKNLIETYKQKCKQLEC